MPYPTDSPAPPRPIDWAIKEARGSTIALDATREKLELGKHAATPTLKEIIENKTRENGRLRAQAAYLESMQQIGEELRGEVEFLQERMRLAVVSFDRQRKDLDKASQGVWGKKRG